MALVEVKLLRGEAAALLGDEHPLAPDATALLRKSARQKLQLALERTRSEPEAVYRVTWINVHSGDRHIGTDWPDVETANAIADAIRRSPHAHTVDVERTIR